MTEVIAYKKPVAWMYIFALIGGVVCIVAGCVFELYLENDKIMGYLTIAMGVILIAISGFTLFKISKTPNVIISREGDTLIYPDGKCNISEVKNVYCRRAHADGFAYAWGAIILNVNGVEYKYNYVADVERVQNRIAELMQERKSENSDLGAGEIYG